MTTGSTSHARTSPADDPGEVGPVGLGPRSIERPRDRGWTLLGTLDGTSPSLIDQGGLIQPAGAAWSLDWWIGADDRWYLPAREPTTRQRRLGPGPVIETTVRIPSGDARHVAYRALAGGGEVTVVEVENDSPVPVALALAVRPYPVAATQTSGPRRSGRVEPGAIRLDGRVVLVDDEAAIVLPRPPNDHGFSNDDLLARVEHGEPLTGSSATGSTANGVLLYPVPHRTSVRLLLVSTASPSGPALGAGAGSAVSLEPREAPSAATVTNGWTSIVDSGARFELPDDGIAHQVQAAVARSLLAARRLGQQAVALEPGAGAVLAALALSGHHRGLDQVLDALAASFPTSLSSPDLRHRSEATSPSDPAGPPSPAMAAAAVVAGAAQATELLGWTPGPALLEWATQVTHLVEAREEAGATVVAHRGLAALARSAGDLVGAARLDQDLPPLPEPDLAALSQLQQEATPAGYWPGASADGIDGADGADDVVAAARFVAATRALLIDDRGSGLDLVPTFPTAWRGGGVEVHRAPTRFGALSFGIRWHGPRPALLWQLDREPAAEPVVIRAPGLDADWVTTEARGETLLAGAGETLPPPPAAGQSFS